VDANDNLMASVDSEDNTAEQPQSDENVATNNANETADKFTLTLEANSVSEDAEQLLQEFLDNRGSDIQIDCEKVERFDTPCVEVLLSAARTWSDAGHKFELTNIPAPLKHCLEILAIDQAELEAKE